MTKTYQTGTRTAIVAKYATQEGHRLIILETNVPGVFYLIEERVGERPAMSKSILIRNAQEIWQQFGIDLYSEHAEQGFCFIKSATPKNTHPKI